ncbi:O-Antigen ligase [bacterium BMS3Abin15]|nr:O-Antigen ligase [bacterium BMS3Abin15]HDZ85441.1 hypothetical protein [Candidatus Moranbacteria bacterium]
MTKMTNTKKMVYLSVFLTPLYLIRFKIFSIPTNILEILIFITFISFVLENGKIGIINFYKQHKKYVLAALFILVGLAISTFINQNYLTGFGIIKGWFIVPLILAFVIINTIENRRDVENIIKVFYFSAFIVSVVGLIYLFKNNLTYDLRLKAFFLSPNHLAMFLAPAIILGIRNLELGIKNFKKPLLKNIKLYISLISLAVISLSLYLTYSYAAWAAIILSFVLLAFITKINISKKASVSIILIILLLAIGYTQTSSIKFQDLINLDERSSIASRIMIWESSTKILEDNFIFGIGPGNFQDKYLEYQKYFSPYLEWAVPQPHNLYLAFWLQSGIIGLAGFLFLITTWIKELVIVARKQKSGINISISAALIGIIFYILIHGLVDTTYWKNDLAIIFWTILALGATLTDKTTD